MLIMSARMLLQTICKCRSTRICTSSGGVEDGKIEGFSLIEFTSDSCHTHNALLFINNSSTDTKKEEVQPKSVRKSAEKTISEVGHFVESAVREEVDALFGCKYHDHGVAPKESKAVPEPTKRTLLHFHRKVEPVSSKSIGGRRGASSSVKVNEHPEEIEHHLTFLDVMETYADNINRYGF
jgi:hypothetical protein